MHGSSGLLPPKSQISGRDSEEEKLAVIPRCESS